MGASSSVVSHRAFQGLTRNAAGDCALFLLPRNNKGQKKEKQKMNKLLIIVGVAALAVTMTGCGNDTEGWYPISGGYINLRNVHVITTEIDVWGQHASPITRESIAQLKKHVAEKYEETIKKGLPMIHRACIKFDDFTVNLPKEAESKREVLRLLDSYLDMVEDLKLPVK